tara:strand:- start:1 stop:141 length:141 start_codon:yes stop_codon:yes gene_type:complete
MQCFFHARNSFGFVGATSTPKEASRFPGASMGNAEVGLRMRFSVSG